MKRTILLCLLLFLNLGIGFRSQALADDDPKSDATASQYDKLETFFSSIRDRNQGAYAMRSVRSVDEASYVSLGGIEQWVTIRGQDRDNPVLLFVHGGPGDVTNPWSFALFATWQEKFTVVQWDQRGAGRTLRKTGPSVASSISLQRIVDDGIELTEYLRGHLKHKKIILVGHSFGSIVGVLMVRARPELFHAYVGTGQVADNQKNYSVAYHALLDKARTLRNRRAIEELTSAGPPPYESGHGFGVQRKWANAFEGADQFLYGTIGLTLAGPGNSVRDLLDSIEGQQLSAERLVAQTAALGPKDLGLEFKLPMFVFHGAEDFTTPTALALRYWDSIKAPRKSFVPIEGGGHFAVFMKSEIFLEQLIERVRPLTVSPE